MTREKETRETNNIIMVVNLCNKWDIDIIITRLWSAIIIYYEIQY
jgi:hypothetical protein